MLQALPPEVRQFLLTSIPTVPHLEMLLLLWREPDVRWSSEAISARLYITRDLAARIADDLCRADFLDQDEGPGQYRCQRGAPLTGLLRLVDAAYSHHLREVSRFIHANPNRMAVRYTPAPSDPG